MSKPVVLETLRTAWPLAESLVTGVLPCPDTTPFPQSKVIATCLSVGVPMEMLSQVRGLFLTDLGLVRVAVKFLYWLGVAVEVVEAEVSTFTKGAPFVPAM